MSVESIALLGGEWPGFNVERVEREAGSPPQVLVYLVPDEDVPRRCGQCGQEAKQVHETYQRRARDLPMFEAQTTLVITTCRVVCEHCGGPKREAIDWLDEKQRVTQRMGKSVWMLCRWMSIRHVAQFYGLHWHTVKRLDKAHLLETLGTPDFSGVEVIGVDEFALHKGHRYATVVVEPSRKRVLWVGPGRDRVSFRKFFQQLGPDGCAAIRAVVMDQSTAYELEVREHCLNAEIVFDLFHIVAKYGREVIDRVRVDEANRLRHDKPARRVVKSSRWLLLRNPGSLRDPRSQVKLDELLQANQAILVAYVMREDLKALWNYRHRGYARRAFHDWYQRAMDSGIGPLMTFAQRLKPYLHGILAHTRWPLHTSLIEGINNRIKVIKRMAYGFRDQEYFFLKIRDAFPG